jgi:hypothetical protein
MRAFPSLLPALAAVLVVALGVALAGCGSGDSDVRNAYVGSASRAVAEFGDSFGSLQSEVRATSTPAQDRRTLDRFGTAVDRLAVALREIHPPKVVRRLHAGLIADVRAYRTLIDRARPGFASSDPRKVITARTTFSTAVERVNAQITRTIDAINRALRG